MAEYVGRHRPEEVRERLLMAVGRAMMKHPTPLRITFRHATGERVLERVDDR